VTHSQDEVADRVALRLLVDTYAREVDGRDPSAVAALFCAQGRLVSHFHPKPGAAPVVRCGRAEITAALEEGLAVYRSTTHVVGGQVVALHGERAEGETTCLAHHVYERHGGTRLLVLAVRYQDAYAREDGGWRFSERQLRLDWRDDRPLEAP